MISRDIGVRCFILGLVCLWGIGSLAAPMTLMYEPKEKPQVFGRCFKTYTEQFKRPGRVLIAVALGYSDTIDQGEDLVMDRPLKRQIFHFLTKPCRYDRQGFCDFRVVREEVGEPIHFRRTLEGRGSERIDVEVLLMDSSYGELNSENKTVYREEQNRKSEAARKFFAWSLQNADVVFYEGHSRDGGGPDFFPPRAARSGKVDYPWYRKFRPGLEHLLAVLQKVESPPHFLGLFSCASDSHFRKSLAPYFKSRNLILSTRLVDGEGTKEAVLSSLEALLNFECPTELAARVRPYSFVVRSSQSLFF